MSASTLKLIAIITMLIDHIGAIFFPDQMWIRMIGRIAFPIFAYFIAEGFFRTSDVKKYMQRLLIFAFISQWPFSFAFDRSIFLSLNVFFTLFFGLYAIYKYDQSKNMNIVSIIGILAQVLNTDYGIYGVYMIFIFYKYHEDFKNMVKYQAILNGSYLGLVLIIFSLNGNSLSFGHVLPVLIQGLCLLSLILIKYYNGEKGYNFKYIFYAFYPVHLTILGLIKFFAK